MRSGGNWLAGVQVDTRAELKETAAGRAVIDTIPGIQLKFSVARVEEGGTCSGYTLTNRKLKTLGFRVVKWKHVTPLPADKVAAAKLEDTIAWVDMPVNEEGEEGEEGDEE